MPGTASILTLLVAGPLLAGLWARQRRTRNAGEVDVAWTFLVGLGALLQCALGEGWGPRRALYGALCAAWSLRLGLHLARRVAGEAEDGRYAVLRERLGERFDRWMVGFYALQGVSAWALSLPLGVLANGALEGWRAWDLAALLLWALSLAGEAVADRQLAAWRRDPAHRGRTCRQGLWRLSRHPNYFFEWLHWCAYPLAAVGLPLGWATWLAPLGMLLLVTRVTGVPPTEAQALRSRGDDYRAYQRTTNAFFPGPPRPDPEAAGTPRAEQRSI